MSDALALLQQQTPEVLCRFVETLYADPELNAARAAAAVGAPGKAREFLDDRRVRVLMAATAGDLRETHGSIRHGLVRMLAAMASYDPAACFDEYDNLKSIKDIPEEIRPAISDIQRKADGSFRIKFHNRVTVIELLFKLFGDLDSVIVPGTTAKVVLYRKEQSG